MPGSSGEVAGAGASGRGVAGFDGAVFGFWGCASAAVVAADGSPGGAEGSPGVADGGSDGASMGWSAWEAGGVSGALFLQPSAKKNVRNSISRVINANIRKIPKAFCVKLSAPRLPCGRWHND